MRNLKKILALVLALVMSLSLVTMANADFSDAADIDNKEAVDVMAAAGILEGSDGKYAPKDILTREQAAKIVTYMILGASKADKLTTLIAPFSDVEATRWSAGAIAYCADQGILDGVGGGKFDPTGKLTGLQFGKMLLCALGYDASIEGLTGDTFAIKTATLAVDLGLDAGIDASLSAQMSREDAAQMALNAAKTTLVKYTGGTTVELPGGTKVVVGATRSDVTSDTLDSVDYIDNDGNKVQFAEKYMTDLELKSDGDDATDAFGRPGHTWYYDNEAVGTYADTPVKTWTGPVIESEMYKSLTGTNGVATIANVWQDGVDESTTLTVNKGNKASTDVVPYTGMGIVAELYKDSSDNYTLVAVREYIGKVTKVVAADPDTDTDRRVEITVKTDDGTQSNKTFTTENFAKDDIVLVTVDRDDSYAIKSAKLAEKIENVAVTGYKTGNVLNATVTAGGTTYKYSQNVAKSSNNVNVCGGAYTMTGGATYTFWLDSMGNIIDGETYTAAASTDYYYVNARVESNTSLNFSSKFEAKYQLIDMAGKISTVTVIDTDATPDVAIGKIVTVEDDSDNAGYKKLTVKGADGTKGFQTASITALNKTTPVIGGNIVANAETVFVLETADGTWKVYTGIANLPSYTKSGSYNKTPTAMVGSDGYADVVFVGDLYGWTADSNTADDVFYLLTSTSTDKRYDAAQDVEYYVFNAIVDGKLTTVNGAASTITNGDIGLVKNAVYDSKGYITSVTNVTEADEYVEVDQSVASKKFTYSTPVLTVADVATYLLADDAVVYIYDTAAETLQVGTAADLADKTAGSTANINVITKSSTDKTVVALYFYGTFA